MSRFPQVLSRTVGRVFPERRIYVRSDAATGFWTLNPISQAGMAIVLSGFLGWTALTSWAFVTSAIDGRMAQSRLEATTSAYEIKLAALRDRQRLLEDELNRSNGRGVAATSQLSAKQRILVDTAARLQTAEVELTGLRSAYKDLVVERRVERDQINGLNEEVIALRLSLAETVRRDGVVSATLETFAATMNGVIAERDRAAEQTRVLDTRVAVLRGELGQWEQRQENLLAQLETASRTSLNSLGALFVGSDVNLDSILRQTRRDYTGRGGGPLDDDGTTGETPAPEDGERVAALMNDLERISLLRIAVDRLPFGLPTRGAERTSGFGPRRRKMHKGIDLAAPRGTPIYSTAGGVVVFSGRQRGYGIVVKIRHAFGFETVYAHLSKSRVKVGQRVKRGQQVADMGSTGRSSGSHLHYEVRIDGKAVNPSKFIKAPKNVL